MGDTLYIIIFVGLIIGLTVAIVVMSGKQKKYMEDQRQNNTEKQKMLELMSRALEGEYDKYSYVVGYYTKIKQHLNVTTYYYFPYILAFSEEEMNIFPFIKEGGNLYLRNRLPVNWNATKFQYKNRKKGVTLTFKMIGETMPIHVDYVIKSSGIEKSDRPIGVYQEAEVEKLKSYLEGYRSRSQG